MDLFLFDGRNCLECDSRGLFGLLFLLFCILSCICRGEVNHRFSFFNVFFFGGGIPRRGHLFGFPYRQTHAFGVGLRYKGQLVDVLLNMGRFLSLWDWQVMVDRGWLDIQWMMDNWHVVVAVRTVGMIHLMHVLFMVSRQKVGFVDSAFRGAIAVFIFFFFVIGLRMNLLFVI